MKWAYSLGYSKPRQMVAGDFLMVNGNSDNPFVWFTISLGQLLE